MAGRASIELKSQELGVDVTSRPDVVGTVVDRIKEREAAGWSYEAADASFELLVRDELGQTRSASLVLTGGTRRNILTVNHTGDGNA